MQNLLEVGAPVKDKYCFTETPPLPFDPVVAMAYIPFQTDTAMYEPTEALCKGTLYPCLNKPFLRGALR